MKSKAVSEVMLALLLTSMLTLTFNIQPVRASGTIYIRADGSVDPSTAPIQRDGDIYAFTGDIFDRLVIERSNITVDGNGFRLGYMLGGSWILTLQAVRNVTIQKIDMAVTDYAYCVALFSSSNNTIFSNKIGDGVGIYIDSSSDNNTISENNIWTEGGGVQVNSKGNIISGNKIWSHHSLALTVTSCCNNTIYRNSFWQAISLSSAWNNNVYGNTISADMVGYAIYLGSSNNNTIFGNSVNYPVILQNSFNNIIFANRISGYLCVSFSSSSNNSVIGNYIYGENDIGITSSSSSNIFYHNNFMGYFAGASIQNSTIAWDNGYTSGGNYWRLYDGVDLYSGPYQNETGSDGIGDTPYLIAPGNRDNYPLIEPYVGFDVAVINVLPLKTIVPHGSFLPINVTVKNQGRELATFNLALEATYKYSPCMRMAKLQANTAQGWNYSIPGPAITVYLGDTIVLTLEAADNLHHKFYVDYSGNAFPDSNEPQSSSFINTNITFSFVADTVGIFKYYCAYYQDTMFGELIVKSLPDFKFVCSQKMILASGEEKNATFTLNTNDFVKGKYIISAYATPIIGEFDTSDNAYTDGSVIIWTILGDLDGDSYVGPIDLNIFAASYGKHSVDALFNILADLDSDSYIGPIDLNIFAANYGKHAFRVAVVVDDNYVPPYSDPYVSNDHLFIVSILKNAGYDATLIFERGTYHSDDEAISYSDIKDFNAVIWVGDTKHFDDNATVTALYEFYKNGGGVLLVGDDATWGQTEPWWSQGQFLPWSWQPDLTHLNILDNGWVYNHLVNVVNVGHPIVQGIEGVTFSYDLDIDYTEPKNEGEIVLAYSPNSDSINNANGKNEPVVVAYDGRFKARGRSVTILLVLSRIPSNVAQTLLLNSLDWIMTSQII